MKQKLILLFIVLIIVSVAICSMPLIVLYNNHVWKYSADYKEYADDFNAVMNYIKAEFPEETDKWLSISHAQDHRIAIFDPDANKYLDIPSEVFASLEIIYKNGFPDKDSNFDTIRIHGERISFCISAGQYALVFSPNERPTWVNSPDEKVKVKAKSIRDGWYHVTKSDRTP